MNGRLGFARGLVVVLCAFVLIGIDLRAQDHKAALSADVEARGLDLHDTDPLRSDGLSFFPTSGQDILGKEHIAEFLNRFGSLLRDGTRTSDSLPLSVFHFGGSHVQAGRIGWAFRKRLSLDRPGLVVNRGILPPHRLVGENGPPEVLWSSLSEWTGQRSAHRRHRGHWGITGLEATSERPDTVRMWNGESNHTGCLEGLDILSAPGGRWNWDTSSRSRASLSTSFDMGDTLLLWSSDSMARLHGVWMRQLDAAFVYHDLGGNGASSAAWLRHAHLEDQLEQRPIDLAILAWGINDAHMRPDQFDPGRFVDRYARLIRSLRSAHPSLDILLITNSDSHYRHRHNPNAEHVRNAMRTLVEEMGVACWDLYGALGGPGSMDRLHRLGFAADDHLHFNRTGYELIGEMLYDTLARNALLANRTEP